MAATIEKISIQRNDGSVFYVDTERDVNLILAAISTTKVVYKKIAAVQVLHNKYFAMIDELIHNADTGYTKGELHNALKPALLNYFKDFTHYYTTGVFEMSTKNLTAEGWSALIEQLKSTALDIFRYSFK